MEYVNIRKQRNNHIVLAGDNSEFAYDNNLSTELPYRHGIVEQRYEMY